MHIRKALAVTSALVLTLLALAPLGASEHWEDTRPCADNSYYIPEDSPESTYPVYIAYDQLHGGGWNPMWIYAESNGQQGLQRDDGYCYMPGTTTETRDLLLF